MIYHLEIYDEQDQLGRSEGVFTKIGTSIKPLQRAAEIVNKLPSGVEVTNLLVHRGSDGTEEILHGELRDVRAWDYAVKRELPFWSEWFYNDGRLLSLMFELYAIKDEIEMKHYERVGRKWAERKALTLASLD